MSGTKLTDTLNRKVRKGGRFVSILIVGLVLISAAGYASYVLISHVKNSAAESFLVAFEMIEDFDDQPNVYSKQDMEKDIVRKLDEIIVSYGITASAKRALFYKGYVYYYTENYEKSTKSFNRFLKKFNAHDLAAKATYFLAFAQYHNEDLESAIDTLKVFESEDKFKDSYFTPVALLAIAQFYEELQDKESAIKYYKMIIQDYDESSQADMATKKKTLLQNDISLYE